MIAKLLKRNMLNFFGKFFVWHTLTFLLPEARLLYLNWIFDNLRSETSIIIKKNLLDKARLAVQHDEATEAKKGFTNYLIFKLGIKVSKKRHLLLVYWRYHSV